MKTTTRIIEIQAYTDDAGNPICFSCNQCGHICKEWKNHDDGFSSYAVPGPSCPVWHGESKSEWQPMVYLLALMGALEIPHPEWWLTKPPEFIAECGKAITAQAKLAQEK